MALDRLDERHAVRELERRRLVRERRRLTLGIAVLLDIVVAVLGFEAVGISRHGAALDDVTWSDVKNTFSLVEVRTEVVDAIMSKVNGTVLKGRTIRIESRGNKEAGVSRTRLRSDKPGGGYKGRSGKGSYGGHGGRSGQGGQGGQGNHSGAKKKSDGPKHDWNAMFADKPMRSDKKKKKKG
jgi:hypothetical protein